MGDDSSAKVSKIQKLPHGFCSEPRIALHVSSAVLWKTTPDGYDEECILNADVSRALHP